MNGKRMKLTIRSATMADEPEIKGLLKSTSGVWQEWWRDTAVAIALESAGALALVASRKEKIVGFACFHDVGFRAYLSEMVVSESEQGGKIGSKLLQRAEQLLSDRGCQLIVADAYPPAEGFYRSRG
jgi:predicted N-acetyltransferase YhbS